MAYQPVPVTNLSGASNLAHLASVFYKRKGLDRLLSKFHFRSAGDTDIIDRNNGKTAQFFRYTNMTANTTAKSPEGAVGTSLGVSTRTLSVTLSQYTNFITVSDFLKETAIDNVVQQCAELLGEQAGLSVDTITRNILDSEAASTAQTLLGANLTASDFRNSRHLLQGVNVEPFPGGRFKALAHPYVTFDVINDPAANGLADIYKHTNPEKAGLITNPDRDVVAVVGNCEIKESTNVALIAGTPNKWRVYIFGQHGYACVDLAGRGPSKITNPKTERFAIHVEQGSIGPWDPEGVIGGFVSYNYKYAAVVTDGTFMGGTYRFKTIDAPSSIVA